MQMGFGVASLGPAKEIGLTSAARLFRFSLIQQPPPQGPHLPAIPGLRSGCR